MSEPTEEHGKFMLKRNKNTTLIKQIFKHSSNESFTLQNMPKMYSKIIGASITILLIVSIFALLFKFLIKKKYLLIL